MFGAVGHSKNTLTVACNTHAFAATSKLPCHDTAYKSAIFFKNLQSFIIGVCYNNPPCVINTYARWFIQLTFPITLRTETADENAILGENLRDD